MAAPWRCHWAIVAPSLDHYGPLWHCHGAVADMAPSWHHRDVLVALPWRCSRHGAVVAPLTALEVVALLGRHRWGVMGGHGAVVRLSWRCHWAIMGPSWHRYGTIVAPSLGHRGAVVEMSLGCRRSYCGAVVAPSLGCRGVVVKPSLGPLWHHGIVLSWRRRGAVIAPSWRCHWAVVASSLRRRWAHCGAVVAPSWRHDCAVVALSLGHRGAIVGLSWAAAAPLRRRHEGHHGACRGVVMGHRGAVVRHRGAVMAPS